MERFRSRVIGVTFSTPGIRRPEKEINDDELLGTLQQIIGKCVFSLCYFLELHFSFVV